MTAMKGHGRAAAARWAGASLAATMALLASGLTGVLAGAAPAMPGPGRLPVDRIRLPPGFHIDVYAADVPGARELALAPDGTVFVGSKDDRVYALPDRDGDHRADRVIVIARGLDVPNGVAFRSGALYVGEIHRIVRYDDILRHLEAPPPPALVRELPPKRWHGRKFIAFGPDGLLYFGQGMPCNVCERRPPFGTIRRMRPDGTDLQTFARGVRNSSGFDWDPRTGDLWFTDNGRDRLGDNRPPDELNHAPHAGMDFGFPYCHGGTIPDPEFGAEHPCSEFTPPAQALGPHVAPLGMRFYTGRMFPPQYRHRIFIAEHGSWNRSRKIGYRVTMVTLEHGRAVAYQPFAEGWLQPDESVWGRPVDVLVMPDGALLVSDDHAGAVYRISYGP